MPCWGGYIVARVSGEPYEQYIQKHIFDPLGMTHSTVQPQMPEDLRPFVSKSYTYADGAFQPFPDYLPQPAVLPSGFHQASVTDMARFMIARLEGGFYGDASTEMRILYREEGNIRISTIRRRFWLNNPISPGTGQTDNRLWWLLIPLALLLLAVELGFAPYINGIWTKLFPFLAEPQNRSLDALFAPEMRSHWIGAWDFFLLFVIASVFNNFLSGEFLFRGVLLPKMSGIFGRWD